MRDQSDLGGFARREVECCGWCDGEKGDADAAIVRLERDGEQGPRRRRLVLNCDGVERVAGEL